MHHSDAKAYTAICAYISEKIWGRRKPFPEGTVMAVVDGNEMVGAAVFYDYDYDAGVIQVSAAANTPKWLTRRILFEMFDYAFNTIGCQAVVARVDPDNNRLGRIFPAYGFKKYEIPRLRGRNKSEVVFVLGDDDWRANGFHKEHEHGQESSRSNAA